MRHMQPVYIPVGFAGARRLAGNGKSAAGLFIYYVPPATGRQDTYWMHHATSTHPHGAPVSFLIPSRI